MIHSKNKTCQVSVLLVMSLRFYHCSLFKVLSKYVKAGYRTRSSSEEKWNKVCLKYTSENKCIAIYRILK